MLLHHRNASAHNALLTWFIANNNMTVVSHHLHLRDLALLSQDTIFLALKHNLMYTQNSDHASCDIFMFPKLKMKLKGTKRKFQWWRKVKQNHNYSNMIGESDFQGSLLTWQCCWVLADLKSGLFKKDSGQKSSMISFFVLPYNSKNFFNIWYISFRTLCGSLRIFLPINSKCVPFTLKKSAVGKSGE